MRIVQQACAVFWFASFVSRICTLRQPLREAPAPEEDPPALPPRGYIMNRFVPTPPVEQKMPGRGKRQHRCQLCRKRRTQNSRGRRDESFQPRHVRPEVLASCHLLSMFQLAHGLPPPRFATPSWDAVEEEELRQAVVKAVYCRPCGCSRAYGFQSVHVHPEHPCPNHNIVHFPKPPRAYNFQSIHAQTMKHPPFPRAYPIAESMPFAEHPCPNHKRAHVFESIQFPEHPCPNH